jgi:hypothetical protein
MLSPLWITIVIAGISGLVGVLLIALIWLIGKHRKLKHDYEDLSEIVHGLNNDFRDLYTSTLSIDERMASTNEQISLIIEKVSNFQQVEPATNHPYGQAIQKVRSGASVSELMQTSGLSQDEAALLIRLHGSKK